MVCEMGLGWIRPTSGYKVGWIFGPTPVRCALAYSKPITDYHELHHKTEHGWLSVPMYSMASLVIHARPYMEGQYPPRGSAGQGGSKCTGSFFLLVGSIDRDIEQSNEEEHRRVQLTSGEWIKKSYLIGHRSVDRNSSVSFGLYAHRCSIFFHIPIGSTCSTFWKVLKHNYCRISVLLLS